MKRSEFNRIIQSIADHQNKYAITGMPDESQPDPHFEPSGCDVCRGGGNDIFDVECLTHDSVRDKTFEGIEFEICSSCLCIIHNADESGLDFCVDDEDVDESHDSGAEAEPGRINE